MIIIRIIILWKEKNSIIYTKILKNIEKNDLYYIQLNIILNWIQFNNNLNKINLNDNQLNLRTKNELRK